MDEEVYNNKDLEISLAPSDIAPKYFKFLEKNRKEWVFVRNVFLDSADQATILDRIHLILGWINTNNKIFYYVLDTCKEHIRELECYSCS
ncbi:hypothetical protein ACSW9O_10605 [Clostridium perfringens]